MIETPRPPAAARERRELLPFPELVDPRPHEGPWTIEDSNDQDWLPTNGATNKPARRLWVPLEPGGECVTRHELAHVKFSPETLPRVRYPLVFLQGVEDARINLGLEAIGLPVELDRAQQAHVIHLLHSDAKRGDYAAVIVRAVASLGTSAAPALRRELESLSPTASTLALDWFDRIGDRLRAARLRVDAAVAPFEVGRELARALAKDLDRRGLVRKDYSVKGLGCCHVELAPGEGSASGKGGPLGRGSAAYERWLERRRGAPPVASGRLKISRPPLSVHQRGVLRAGVARRLASTEGTHIRRIDRLALDRAIFKRSGRGGGATILVDTSGSMSLEASQVEALVRAAGGAAVVAIYSGRGDEGELRIVARGDRRVPRPLFAPYGGGNVVDLPALEWLGRQPEPRIWVSDGGVTGVDDEGCPSILEACRRVTERNRIERIDTADEAVARLEEMTR